MNFIPRTTATLSVVILALFMTVSFPLSFYRGHFSFIRTAEARPNRAERAQNISQKQRKLPERQARRETKKKARKDSQKNYNWGGGSSPQATVQEKTSITKAGFTKPTYSPPIKSDITQGPDLANNVWLEDNYKIMMSQYDIMMDTARFFDPYTGAEMRRIAEGYLGMAKKVDYYRNLSYQRHVTTEELRAVNEAIQQANDLNDQFTDARNSGIPSSLYKQLTQPIVVPAPVHIYPPPQPTQEDHEQMCLVERRKAAANGVVNSSSWYWYMVNLGCMTQESVCQTSFGRRDSRCQ